MRRLRLRDVEGAHDQLRRPRPRCLFFSTGPFAGFHVDDVDVAKAEMEAAGVEFVGKRGASDDGYAWWHFRAPDGNVYEIVSRPG